MKDAMIFLLRIALGVAFLSAVADRFGMWGAVESPIVTWGNMDNFLQYTSTLTFGASGLLLTILGYGVTILEAVFGIFLIIGYKTKRTALFSGVLLLIFGLSMALNLNIKYAFDYSVFSAAFGALLLAYQGKIKWSLDSAYRR